MLRSLLSQLSDRIRFIRACWRRGVYLTPLFSLNLTSLIPWVHKRERHGPDVVLYNLRKLRRQPFNPQNWNYYAKSQFITVEMPRRYMIMLIAYWEAGGDLLGSYQAYKTSHHLCDVLKRRIDYEIGLTRRTEIGSYYILHNKYRHYVVKNQKGIRYNRTPEGATLFCGGPELDEFLITNPTLTYEGD